MLLIGGRLHLKHNIAASYEMGVFDPLYDGIDRDLGTQQDISMQ